MKKTLTVNLGGTVFNIDDDAYRLLDNYLSNLKIHFRKEAGPSIGKRSHRSRYEPMPGVEPSAFTTRMFISRLPKLCPWLNISQRNA